MMTWNLTGCFGTAAAPPVDTLKQKYYSTLAMIIKIIILILLALILISLGAGMFSLIKDRGETNRTVKFLKIRIVLSIELFVLLCISFMMVLIQPHGLLPPG